MKYNTVLFDFDGTLYDTVEGITKCVQYALSKHGIEAPLEALRCFAGPPLAEKFMEVYGVDSALAEQLVKDYRERYLPIGVYESAPFPGVGDMLLRLRTAGLHLGVATSKPQTLAELLLCNPDPRRPAGRGRMYRSDLRADQEAKAVEEKESNTPHIPCPFIFGRPRCVSDRDDLSPASVRAVAKYPGGDL